jgi:signal transduction histidine kinase
MQAMEGIPAAERKQRVELRNQRVGRLRLSVIECGYGVSAERLPKLFKAFETTKPEGLDLGLSLCKAIFEGHGGQLWYDPALPHGAVFHVLLPSEERVFEPNTRPLAHLEP